MNILLSGLILSAVTVANAVPPAETPPCAVNNCDPMELSADSIADSGQPEIPEHIQERLVLREKALEGHRLIADSKSSREDREHGLDITIEAALAGDPVAQNNLGYLAATGFGNLVERDPAKALFWYEKALEARYPAAAVNIIDLPGRYPELDIPQEVLADANLLMGDAYARGTDVIPYNFNLSLSHYLQAARLGSGRAVMILRELLGQFPDALGPLTDEDAEIIYGN